MQLTTSLRRMCVGVSGALVATMLVSGCGHSAAEDRAAHVRKDADSIAKDADKFFDKGWRGQAEREYWDRQQFYDSWDKITPRNTKPRCR
jgi:hypothetical protein